MENFDVVQALVRTALAANVEASAQQVRRLADRLTESGALGDARKLRGLVARSENRQAVEPINLHPSDLASQRTPAQRIGAKTALPVDRESGAPLCELVLSDRRGTLPVLPVRAQAAYDSLIREWRHEEELIRLGLPVSHTLLIYGPPGTGKTTLALAIATHLGLPAIIARLDGLISSLLGNTARNLGTLFDFCNRYDCVLVLDEFDAMAKIRDDTHEVGEIKRVVNALLQNLDKRTPFGLTIAVTNHEQLLDSAVWRRFEHQIRLGLPSFGARTEIAKISLAGYPDAEPVARAISFLTDGRSGADVRTLTVALLKMSVLSPGSPPAPIAALREAAQATGVEGLDRIEESDANLAEALHEQPAAMSLGDLGAFFGKDRKTISRWLNQAETKV
jgi:MoxR-like ATPase